LETSRGGFWETLIIEVPSLYPTTAYSFPISSVYPQTSETPKLLDEFSNVILYSKSIL